MATLPVTRRFDLTDARWAALQLPLSTATKPGRPPKSLHFSAAVRRRRE